MALMQHILTTLKERDPLPPLYPHAPWRPELSRQILQSNDEALFGIATEGSSMAVACRAGLLTWNDDLEAAHKVAQGIETPTGSFWHAIIHRREGDASNSRHWWRETGDHAVFLRIYEHVGGELAEELDIDAREFQALVQNQGQWLPDEFVSACEQVHKRSETDLGLRRIQVIEMETLLNWCFKKVNSL